MMLLLMEVVMMIAQTLVFRSEIGEWSGRPLGVAVVIGAESVGDMTRARSDRPKFERADSRAAVASEPNEEAVGLGSEDGAAPERLNRNVRKQSLRRQCGDVLRHAFRGYRVLHVRDWSGSEDMTCWGTTAYPCWVTVSCDHPRRERRRRRSIASQSFAVLLLPP